MASKEVRVIFILIKVLLWEQDLDPKEDLRNFLCGSIDNRTAADIGLLCVCLYTPIFTYVLV
jgi:hypothetical protein